MNLNPILSFFENNKKLAVKESGLKLRFLNYRLLLVEVPTSRQFFVNQVSIQHYCTLSHSESSWYEKIFLLISADDESPQAEVTSSIQETLAVRNFSHCGSSIYVGSRFNQPSYFDEACSSMRVVKNWVEKGFFGIRRIGSQFWPWPVSSNYSTKYIYFERFRGL